MCIITKTHLLQQDQEQVPKLPKLLLENYSKKTELLKSDTNTKVKSCKNENLNELVFTNQTNLVQLIYY